MYNRKDIVFPDQKYKILGRFRYEVIVIECPWCRSMINIVEDIENKCDVCGRKIRMEDIENDIL